MFTFAVVEINGRQYKISPGQELLVDFLGEEEEKYECEKVLLKVDGDKLALGYPYLKEKMEFEVLESIKEPKIRVATYKAKANTRKIIGSRRKLSRIKHQVKAVKKT